MQCDGQLPASAHIEREAFFVDPPGYFAAQECLGGIVHILSAAERRPDLFAAGAEVVLVDDEQRSAVLLGKVGHVRFRRCWPLRLHHEPCCGARHSAPDAVAPRATAAAVDYRRDGSLRRAGDRRDERSHSLRGADSEYRQPVGDDLTGGLAQCQARGVQVGGLLVALRQHPARVVEPVIVAGKVFQVAAHPVWFPQGSRRFQHPREFTDGAQQRTLFVVAEQFQVCGVGDQAEFGGAAC